MKATEWRRDREARIRSVCFCPDAHLAAAFAPRHGVSSGPGSPPSRPPPPGALGRSCQVHDWTETPCLASGPCVGLLTLSGLLGLTL